MSFKRIDPNVPTTETDYTRSSRSIHPKAKRKTRSYSNHNMRWSCFSILLGVGSFGSTVDLWMVFEDAALCSHLMHGQTGSANRIDSIELNPILSIKTLY